MNITIVGAKVEKTNKTKNGEPLFSLILDCFTPVSSFQTIYLFTNKGRFLLKQNLPIVKFRDYDPSKKPTPGKIDYQAQLYNRLIEYIPALFPPVVKYLLKNDFIDKDSLSKNEPRLYHLALSSELKIF